MMTETPSNRQEPSPSRLATLPIRELIRLLVIVGGNVVDPQRRRLAGIPPVETIRAEIRRREFAVEVPR